MKTIAALIAVSTSVAFSQQPDADPHAADREALRAIGARYEKAINDGNLSPLADSLLPSMSTVFVTGKEVAGVEAMQKYYEDIKAQLGEGSSFKVKLIPDRTEFFGDMAIAHGRSDESVNFANGSTLAYQTVWTAVLKKTDGQWKGARLHVSMDPVENPIIELKTKWRERLIGGGGLLVGLVLAGAMVWLRGKRRRA